MLFQVIFWRDIAGLIFKAIEVKLVGLAKILILLMNNIGRIVSKWLGFKATPSDFHTILQVSLSSEWVRQF